MAKPRPIVVLDTSVFLKDAMSPTHKGAASQILAILPAIATIVLCDEIRQEILEKFSEILGWTEKQVMATYSPVFESGDLGHPGPRAALASQGRPRRSRRHDARADCRGGVYRSVRPNRG